jgi:hypothetical protein
MAPLTGERPLYSCWKNSAANLFLLAWERAVLVTLQRQSGMSDIQTHRREHRECVAKKCFRGRVSSPECVTAVSCSILKNGQSWQRAGKCCQFVLSVTTYLMISPSDGLRRFGYFFFFKSRIWHWRNSFPITLHWCRPYLGCLNSCCCLYLS